MVPKSDYGIEKVTFLLLQRVRPSVPHLTDCELTRPGHDECTNCGTEEPVLRFWEHGGMGGDIVPPVAALCIECLAGHDDAEHVLDAFAQHESIEDHSFDFDDGRIALETTAPTFGSFTHVFHLERDVLDHDETAEYVEYTTGWVVSFSEMYHEGAFVATYSAWTNHATRLIQRLQQ